MKIYTVIEIIPYEGTNLIGLGENLEQAKEIAEDYRAIEEKNGWGCEIISIYETETGLNGHNPKEVFIYPRIPYKIEK